MSSRAGVMSSFCSGDWGFLLASSILSRSSFLIGVDDGVVY